MDDEKRFCSKCGWNDCDYGCTCPPNEEVYQCPMYMHYHPDEVKKFEKAMDEWENQLNEINIKDGLNEIKEATERLGKALSESIKPLLDAIDELLDVIDELEPYQRYELLHPRKKPRGSIRRKRRTRK